MQLTMIILLFFGCYSGVFADVSSCQYSGGKPSTSYSKGSCGAGINHCVKATCPGVDGAMRGCDGDNVGLADNYFCQSNGCQDLPNNDINNQLTSSLGCTGQARICCCSSDNCNKTAATVPAVIVLVLSLMFSITVLFY